MRLLVLGLATAVALSFLPAATAEPGIGGTPCDGPNESVKDDVYDTVFEDPTDPQCGSLSDPCYDDEWGCYGCGPDLVEWIIGPIYCT